MKGSKKNWRRKDTYKEERAKVKGTVKENQENLLQGRGREVKALQENYESEDKGVLPTERGSERDGIDNNEGKSLNVAYANVDLLISEKIEITDLLREKETDIRCFAKVKLRKM